ncbi:HEAT repeat domain-containing protein [Actinoplanes sp. L3-i22]|uniref:HEAT repeat domain-containing protein n=1 Tax=Actinoplanes sp. L3-i22 TaxID=2836373 RepID=UPI001C843876|nr:HEAT repeat domain-containing protein [Actinoplanes sp. L3-i22]
MLRVIDNRAALAELIQRLSDDDELDEIRDALAACGDHTLVPELTAALHRFLDQGDAAGRDVIAGILAGVQGAPALPELLRAAAVDLGDDQDTLDAEIVDLVHTDPAAARPHVLALAAGPDRRLRRMGLNLLGLVAQPSDAGPILDATADPNPGIRTAADPAPDIRTAVGSDPDIRTAVGLILDAAADPDPDIRATAVGALPVESDRTFAALVTALRDVDAGVRVTAAAQLGFQGRAEAIPHLAELAGDHADRVRQFAAIALGRIGGPDTAPALLRLRTDRSRDVREAATEALGSAGGPQAIAALRAMAENPDPEVRIQAAAALPKAGAEVLPLLTALAADPIPEVRTALVAGLARAHAPIRAASAAGRAVQAPTSSEPAAGRPVSAPPTSAPAVGDPASAAGSAAPAPGGFDALVLGLAADPEFDVRHSVARSVRLIAPALAPSILRRYLDDPDLRTVAERELSRLRD